MSTGKAPKSKATKTAGQAAKQPAPQPRTRLAGAKPPKAATGKTLSVSKPGQGGGSVAAQSKSAPAPKAGAKPADPPATEALKKRELIEMVVARSDVKKKFAKPVVEATLEILGEEIARERELNLQPMGKLKHNRLIETSGARVAVVKIRQNLPGDASSAAQKDGLADRPKSG